MTFLCALRKIIFYSGIIRLFSPVRCSGRAVECVSSFVPFLVFWGNYSESVLRVARPGSWRDFPFYIALLYGRNETPDGHYSNKGSVG